MRPRTGDILSVLGTNVLPLLPPQHCNALRATGRYFQQKVQSHVATLDGLSAILRGFLKSAASEVGGPICISGTSTIRQITAHTLFNQPRNDEEPILFGPLSGYFISGLHKLATAHQMQICDQIPINITCIKDLDPFIRRQLTGPWLRSWDHEMQYEVRSLWSTWRWVMCELLRNYMFTSIYYEFDSDHPDPAPKQFRVLLWERRDGYTD